MSAIVEMKFDEYKRREGELDALHARVAQLEAALTKIRDNDPDGWEASVARAVLSETVEGRSA